ncbi:MAG: UDP binding domain-containing protein, partial [Pseudomonadota bacterium]
LTISKMLLAAGAILRLHDPVARDTFAVELPASEKVVYCENNYDACKGTDALLLVTEWPAYRRPDFRKVKELMKTPCIFDGRNIWDSKILRDMGFEYWAIGG